MLGQLTDSFLVPLSSSRILVPAITTPKAQYGIRSLAVIRDQDPTPWEIAGQRRRKGESVNSPCTKKVTGAAFASTDRGIHTYFFCKITAILLFPHPSHFYDHGQRNFDPISPSRIPSKPHLLVVKATAAKRGRGGRRNIGIGKLEVWDSLFPLNHWS